MMLGNFLLALATIACAFSLVGYLLSLRGGRGVLALARGSYYVLAASTTLALGTLVYLFMTHRFDVAYVASYSSKDLPWYFEFSSLWAGQQGTFLLWLFWSSLVGVILLRTTKETESWVMTFYLGIQVFFITILLKRSPFLTHAAPPADGQGLNPLLQDYWMTIHPPVMFLGFALTAVPAAYAMAALASRNYDRWVERARPWATTTLAILGTAIIMGGYWAYKTLGWGGYWGWDPVENASLMPWLATIALVHGFMLQKQRSALRRTNLTLALSAFLLVVYGTFLTRSGVLADFSVHSFVDLGINGFLVIFLGVFAVGAAGLLLWRSRQIKSERLVKNLLAKEFSVFLSLVLLVVTTIIVLLGTSAPLLTRIWGQPGNVNTVYYVRTSLPIGILLAVVLGVMPYLLWRGSGLQVLALRALWPAVAGLAIVGLSILLGFRSPLYILFGFFAVFALLSNFLVFYRTFQLKPAYVGGHLTHVGVAFMLLGLITSNVYSTSEKITVTRGESKKAFGYQFTYQGLAGPVEEKDNAVHVLVTRGQKSFTATPKFFWSEYNRDFMRKPYIKRAVFSDLYISPMAHSVMDRAGQNTLALKQGETKEAYGYKITFENFEVLEHDQEKGLIKVGAVLSVAPYGRKAVVGSPGPQRREPVFVLVGEEQSLIPDTLPGGELIYLAAPKPETKEVVLGFSGLNQAQAAAADYVVLDISRKPLINLLWIGTTCVALGALTASYRWGRRRMGTKELSVRQVGQAPPLSAEVKEPTLATRV